MTKGVIIETIYLRLNGGNPTHDTNYRREDIAAYFPFALAQALMESLKQKKNSSLQTGNKYAQIPAEVYSTIDVEFEWDNSLKSYVSVIPPTLSIAPAQSIRNLAPKAGGISPVFLPSPTSVLDSHLTTAPMWFVRTENGVTKILAKNLSTPLCTYTVELIKDPSALSDSDTVSAPGEAINTAIAKTVQFFMGSVADKEFDNKAINDNG